MKKYFLLLSSLLIATVVFAEQRQVRMPQAEKSSSAQPPILQTLDNSDAVKATMAANTYVIKDIHFNRQAREKRSGYASGFRLHRNWFLSIGHGPFHELTPNVPVVAVGVSVEKREVPGNPNAAIPGAPYRLVVDLTTPTNQANGKLFLYNPRRKVLDSSNTNRGYDITLIYVPDQDPAQGQAAAASQMLAQFGTVHTQLMKQMGMDAALSTLQQRDSAQWNEFMRLPIPDFHLFNLSEKTILRELEPFALTAYYIGGLESQTLSDPQAHQSLGLKTFRFKSIGTVKGTNAIYYERVTNLIHGTSGSPMTYGNFVVSVDSATNCSPMFTDSVCAWIKKNMGKDYPQGMCVRPMEPEGQGTPVVRKNPGDLNQG